MFERGQQSPVRQAFQGIQQLPDIVIAGPLAA
jgi:hypothetical protein